MKYISQYTSQDHSP